MRALIALAVLMFACEPPPPALDPVDLPGMIEETAGAVVTVQALVEVGEAGKGINLKAGLQSQLQRGSGVIVDGGILTARHVVEGAVALAVGRDGVWVPAEVVTLEAGADVAMLLPRRPLPGYTAPLRRARVIPGEPVWLLGLTSGPRQARVRRVGLTVNGLPDNIEVSGEPLPGDSGGAVVDRWGEVVAIEVARGNGCTFATELQ